MTTAGKFAGVIVILVLIGGGIILVRRSATNNKSTITSNTQTTNTTTQTPAAQTSATETVNIKGMLFTPSQITVAKGGTVTWTNNDTVAHTVVADVSDANGPNSGNIEPGGTYSFTFETTGSFQYHCSIHSSMHGTIVVK